MKRKNLLCKTNQCERGQRYVFQNSQKVTKYLGNFCEKNCHQELSKIVQSGHTGPQNFGRMCSQ